MPKLVVITLAFTVVLNSRGLFFPLTLVITPDTEPALCCISSHLAFYKIHRLTAYMVEFKVFD